MHSGSNQVSLQERLATSPARGTPAFCWRDGVPILVLIALSAAIHAWLIRHTEVAARDSIGFIRYAWELEHQPWPEVLRHSHQHPGYPVALLAVSRVLRTCVAGPQARVYQLSAQLTSVIAGMLLVIPMYLLGILLLNRSAGFWGAALFQCLPISSRLMADGLSEATFLFFSATALLWGVLALQRPTKISYALCGGFGALAYLTRPEGALIVIAAGLVLLASQARRAWRRPWRPWILDGAVLAGSAIIIASPYCITVGGITTKPTPQMILSTAFVDRPAERSSRLEASVRIRDTNAHPADFASGGYHAEVADVAGIISLFAPDSAHNRSLWALIALLTELFRGFQYFAAIPVLLGLWLFRHRLRESLASWLIVALCLLHALILWRLAIVMGYLSDRHVILLVLCGVFPAAGAVPLLAHSIIQAINRARAAVPDSDSIERHAVWLSSALLVALTFFSLPETLKTLHANRTGHRAAGLWLAEHATPADPVTDPFCWAHFYAGKLFLEGAQPTAPPGYVPTRYVVMEGPNREHSRLPMMPEARMYAEHGKVVYHWPATKPLEEGKVFVYAVGVN
jgi:hypothetical protein